MAYNVSENYRTIVYSGEALYDCRLTINGILVPIEQIQTIKISSPIIDTTTDTGSMINTINETNDSGVTFINDLEGDK